MPSNTRLATLSKFGFSRSRFLGSWVPDVMAHGSTEPLLPAGRRRS